MKKLLVLIVFVFSLWLLYNQCFWYDVIIYWPNNELITMYPIEEGTTEITLEGDWSKNWNNYTFNGGYTWTTVYYTDWYWKDQSISINSDLYINWQYTIWYTGEQYLDLTENNCWSFNWYSPTFDVTWSIDPYEDFTWNIFNNFADNSLQVLLSNVPNYIQYVLILILFFFVIWIVRRFRKK